jgi:prepilin-type N-terminal cleavage/methylation domain-containing protein
MPFFAEDFVMTYRNKGFTLIELLAVIAILAVLLAVVTPWVGDYVTTAQKLSDRRTLSVLNEALDRYKTEGGSLSALTEGTPMGHVLLHLQTPVVWAGFTHSFLRAAQTYRAQSLAATGSGSSYRLTQYGTYTQEEGTTPVHLFSPDEALDRYKTEGGSLSALTEGTLWDMCFCIYKRP